MIFVHVLKYDILVQNYLNRKERVQMDYVYILRCKDDSLYTGWTNNIEKRLEAHNSGKGAKYTRSRRPVTLVYLEKFEDKIEAQQREREIKKLTRTEKLSLVHSSNIKNDPLIK
jgi:putative endonuclease